MTEFMHVSLFPLAFTALTHLESVLPLGRGVGLNLSFSHMAFTNHTPSSFG